MISLASKLRLGYTKPANYSHAVYFGYIRQLSVTIATIRCVVHCAERISNFPNFKNSVHLAWFTSKCTSTVRNTCTSTVRNTCTSTVRNTCTSTSTVCNTCTSTVRNTGTSGICIVQE